MTQPTLHTGFNKALQSESILTGNVFSNLQFSIFIRGIDTTECNVFLFSKGELYQKDLNQFEQSSGKSHAISQSFKTELYKLCSTGDVSAYVFYVPGSNRPVSYAIIDNKEVKYFEGLGKTAKQVSVNEYILKELVALMKSK